MLALLAGGSPATAAVLGGAMVGLQVSIGALNDLVDVELDRGRKPGKPIPAGLVGRRAAAIVVAAGLAIGLSLSATAGWATLLVAVVGVAVGYAYDLRLKRTVWAWLPFAIGLPLLPVFSWVGATGGIPAAFGLLVPLAVVAGAALALLNGIVDVDRDRAAGVATPAVRLGRERARRLAAVLLGVVAVGALASLAIVGAIAAAWGVCLAGVSLVAVGLVLAGSTAASRRERGWEASAVGLSLIAAGWVVGFAVAGRL